MQPPPVTELRLGVYGSVPEVYPNCFRYPERTRTEGCPYPGWCVEVVNMLTKFMNITVTPVLLGNRNDKADWGVLLPDNVTWNGALGNIQRGEIDTVCLMYQTTAIRSQFFDFSTSMTTARSVFVTSEPTEEFGEYVTKVGFAIIDYSEIIDFPVFRTFEVQLWALFFLVILVQTGCMIVCHWLEGEVMGVSVFRPVQQAWQCFRFFMIQPFGRYRRRTYGGNFLMSMNSLATLLVTSLYSGLLLTRLLDPLPATPFTSSNQMIASVASGKYRLITNYNYNWFFEDLRSSNLSYFRKLREAHSHSDIVVVGSVSEALTRVEKENLIYPTQEDSNTMFEARKRCGLTFVNNTIGLLSMHFVFRKGHPILHAWNQAMIYNQPFLVKTFDKYMRDGGYLSNPGRCKDTDSVTNREGTALNLTDVAGAFLFFIVLCVLAFLVMIAEIAWNVKRRKNKMID